VTIFDLATLDDTTAHDLVAKTMRRFPELVRLFDDPFIGRLIRRRHNLDNFLLLLLVQPDDCYATSFWSSTIRALDGLAVEGAWRAFGSKFRRHQRFDVQSTKSELSLAAWMKGRGISVIIEPKVNGRRACEFVAQTSPPSWWEVKSLRDIDLVEQNERAYLEVQNRFRRLKEPYVLSINDCSALALSDVSAAVKDIKRQIGEHFAMRGDLPKLVESHGLSITLETMSGRGYGYLGIIEQQYVFGPEQMEKVRSRVSSAVGQIPADGAGVVVVDCTMAQWLDEEDVINACFGEDVGSWRDGQPVDRRMPGGVFHPRVRTRISAVAFFKGPADPNSDFDMTVLHNPHARMPLPTDVFRAVNTCQLGRRDAGGGRYKLVRL